MLLGRQEADDKEGRGGLIFSLIASIKEADNEEQRGGSSLLDCCKQCGRRRQRTSFPQLLTSRKRTQQMEDDPPPPSSIASIRKGYNEEGRCGLSSLVATIEEEDNREKEESPPSLDLFLCPL